MKELYYTPEISEFHVGFECEIKNSSDEPFDWEQFKIISVDDAEISIDGNNWYLMDWSFYDSLNAINDKSIRVKCLDKEDIESLGFEYILTSYDGYFRKGKTQISFSYDNKIQINVGIGNVLFDIKNKSELKKLLTQLNII